MRVRVCIALVFYRPIRMVRANPRGFSSLLAAAWGLTEGSLGIAGHALRR